jgi:hypothetical protein
LLFGGQRRCERPPDIPGTPQAAGGITPEFPASGKDIYKYMFLQHLFIGIMFPQTRTG